MTYLHFPLQTFIKFVSILIYKTYVLCLNLCLNRQRSVRTGTERSHNYLSSLRECLSLTSKPNLTRSTRVSSTVSRLTLNRDREGGRSRSTGRCPVLDGSGCTSTIDLRVPCLRLLEDFGF